MAGPLRGPALFWEPGLSPVMMWETASIWIGLLGVALYLGSYLALQLNFLSGQSLAYSLLNIAAAGTVLISLTTQFNLTSVLIQVMWVIISLLGIARLIIVRYSAPYSSDEQALVDAAFPDVPKEVVRGFLSAGTWMDGEDGEILTVQSEPVGELVFLVSGRGEVVIGGSSVGMIGDGVFIGELTALTGAPATATVTLRGPSRYFSMSSRKLRHLAKRNQRLGAALERAFAADVSRKLLHRNAEYAAGDGADQAASAVKMPAETEPV